MDEKKLPKYEPPKIESYTDEDLLNILGSARTGSPGGNQLKPQDFE